MIIITIIPLTGSPVDALLGDIASAMGVANYEAVINASDILQQATVFFGYTVDSITVSGTVGTVFYYTV